MRRDDRVRAVAFFGTLTACALVACASAEPRRPSRPAARGMLDAAAPSATPSEPPDVPSEFSIVATGELSELDVSPIDGATFVRCGPMRERSMYDDSRLLEVRAAMASSRGRTVQVDAHKPLPDSNESKVVRLLHDGSPDNPTATIATRVFGSWPRDAWREDDSTGERGHFNQRYATWKSDHWEAVDPRGPKEPGFWSNPLGLVPWGSACSSPPNRGAR